MLTRHSSQHGFTLTELMIGSTVGLLVLAGATQLYVLNIRASTNNLAIARLAHDMRTLLTLMQQELARSGYSSVSPEQQPFQQNPFLLLPEQLALGNAAGEPGQSCVLYAYDRYPDGKIGVGRPGKATASTTRSNVEQFGFRLSKQRLQLRTGGGSFRCDSGHWQTLHDESLVIDRFTVSRSTTCLNAEDAQQACRSGQSALLHHHLTLQLTAHLKNRPMIQQTLATDVAARNDQWVAAW